MPIFWFYSQQKHCLCFLTIPALRHFSIWIQLNLFLRIVTELRARTNCKAPRAMDVKAHPLIPTTLYGFISTLIRGVFFRILAYGPIPRHIAFIPDGNRRYGCKQKLDKGDAYRVGFAGFIKVLKYCYEMGVPCVSVFAFSIDNFKRNDGEVQAVLDLVCDRADAATQKNSIIDVLGVRIEFVGNLDKLDAATREAMQRAMAATVNNTNIRLVIMLAYKSSDEIVRAVQGSCEARAAALPEDERWIGVRDLERRMYMAGYPEPDILIRTSGATRLSDFLLWQTSTCLLYAPKCLWPEISARHLVWAVLQFQRHHDYLQKIKKKM